MWDGSEPPLVEVSATLTVLEPTPSDDLRFWAIQASFGDRGRHLGAAHLGLQRHRGHPGGCAANWGGYRAGGGELAGTESMLPSARGNPNTRDFAWEVGRPCRLTIRVDGTGWIDGVLLRTLDVAGADRLAGVVVWSEVFARCAEPHTVRWSELRGVAADGTEVEPRAVAVNYQRWSDGGYTNTDSSVDPTDVGGFVQRTGTERRTPQGALLPVSPTPAP
jgi:hypothetical protein